MRVKVRPEAPSFRFDRPCPRLNKRSDRHQHAANHERNEPDRPVTAITDLEQHSAKASITESARVLGIAEGTLKAQLHRARELLRSRCERPPDGDIMMPDELDEILRSDDTIEPSPGFVSAVMRATYRELTELPPLRFPWSRFGIGVAACALMTGSAGALWSRVEVAAPRVLIHLAR